MTINQNTIATPLDTMPSTIGEQDLALAIRLGHFAACIESVQWDAGRIIAICYAPERISALLTNSLGRLCAANAIALYHLA